MTMPNDFTYFIHDFEPALPFLPLTHTTDAFQFNKSILKNAKLEPQFCNIFKENLLYFFYGRPAYRVNSGQKLTLSAAYPIVILLKPEADKYAKRVYPFDSGAYEGGLYDKYMPNKFELDLFLVEPNPEYPGCIPIPDIPARIVSAFFESNANYYFANKFRPFSDNDLEFKHFEAEGYYELIKTKAETEFDDRRSTIEIQTIESVSLSSDTVYTVILPQSFLENEYVRNTVIKTWKSDPLTYPSYRSEPDFLIPIIIDRLGQYFNKKGLI